jgi:hypothetical protein
MKRRLLTVAALLLLLGLVTSCTESPDKAGSGLLQHVPADTPYVFVTSRRRRARPLRASANRSRHRPIPRLWQRMHGSSSM